MGIKNIEKREQVVGEFLRYKSSLGLLPIAFKHLYLKDPIDKYSEDFIDKTEINRWNGAQFVAHSLGSSPIEILVLDSATAMFNRQKGKEIIENPEILFGKRYKFFLKFADRFTADNGEALRIDPKIFKPKLLADLGVSKNFENNYREAIEGKAQTELRNKLPHLVDKDENYDPNLPENKHYEEVARQTIEGILAAFKDLVDNSLPDKDEQYKERVALLAGLAAIEILFVRKDSHRFLNVVAKGFEPLTPSM